jgi:hypothetical protein
MLKEKLDKVFLKKILDDKINHEMWIMSMNQDAMCMQIFN